MNESQANLEDIPAYRKPSPHAMPATWTSGTSCRLLNHLPAAVLRLMFRDRRASPTGMLPVHQKTHTIAVTVHRCDAPSRRRDSAEFRMIAANPMFLSRNCPFGTMAVPSGATRAATVTRQVFPGTQEEPGNSK